MNNPVKKWYSRTLNITSEPEEKRKIIGDTFIQVKSESTVHGGGQGGGAVVHTAFPSRGQQQALLSSYHPVNETRFVLHFRKVSLL